MGISKCQKIKDDSFTKRVKKISLVVAVYFLRFERNQRMYAKKGRYPEYILKQIKV